MTLKLAESRRNRREEMAQRFHAIYLANIAKETAKRGLRPKTGGIPAQELTKIFNESIADFGEEIAEANG